MMNLLVNFESYDTQVVNKDMYMPEEKIVNFNVGFLKIFFKGKLRITMDRLGSNVAVAENEAEADDGDRPSKAYAVVEDRGISSINSRLVSQV